MCIWLYILLYVGLCIYLFVLLYELSMSSTCLVVTQMCLWFAISNLPEEDISYIILWDRILLPARHLCKNSWNMGRGYVIWKKRTFLTLQASQWTYKFPCKLTWILSLRGSWAVEEASPGCFLDGSYTYVLDTQSMQHYISSSIVVVQMAQKSKACNQTVEQAFDIWWKEVPNR